MSERTIEYHPNLPADARARIEALLGELGDEGTAPSEVSDAFEKLDLTIEDVRPCESYTPGDRVRCQLARTPAWVLLALFWDNAETCIHDHEESDCGFRLLEGDLHECRYKVVSGEQVSEVARRPLTMGEVNKSSRGFIHRLGVPQGAGRAVSLHAYSPALDLEEMGVYQEIDTQTSV